MNDYQTFIYKRSYSRWLPEEGRREEWPETVARYADWFRSRVPSSLGQDYDQAINLILDLKVMPSMRCLWSAGAALENDNIAGYNCAYVAIDRVKAIAEILYILMNGAGVGFSVERQYINSLPNVPEVIKAEGTIVFEDSKLGWATGYLDFLLALYDGQKPECIFTNIRPKGATLKTFGGRASGPEPLHKLIKFTAKTFEKAKGRKLNSIEVYDIVCMVANCVVSGGVRRSSTISLSNLTDLRMRDAKSGQFWIENNQRLLSNNSVVYTEKPDIFVFMDEWKSLARSGSGERGIVNREALKASAHFSGRKEADFGVNPCGEIILRSRQFCNLTEVVVRPDDDYAALAEKVKAAVLLGCIQSTLLDFSFLDEEWALNSAEERLLGVSITGLMDNTVAMEYLGMLRDLAQLHARNVAAAMGIPCPAAITCVKPSGTVSQLVDCASGLHSRHSEFYIRRVRVAATDPVAFFLKAAGVPYHPEVGQTLDNANTFVFEFPIRSPQNSVFREDRDAIEQLDDWLKVRRNWTHHNPSVTIYVEEDEWLKVGAWVYENWNEIGGLSFLPYDGGIYDLAPYEEITEEKYAELVKEFPKLEWSLLSKFEEGKDTTEGAKTFACTGDKCELA